MGQNDQQVLATVPRLYGRVASSEGRWRATLDRLAGHASIALVVAGLIGTVAWGSFLAWCVFSLIRWTIG